jgi:hypothetical protein
MYDFLALREWITALYRTQNSDNTIYQPRLALEPFSYNLTIASIAAVAGTATGIIAINANADFYCTRINYSATTGTAQNVGNKTVAQLRVMLVDAGSSRPFFNSALPLESFASNEYPNRFLTYPRTLRANTSVSAQFTGFGTAAETYQLDLTLDGVNVYQYGG